MLCKIVCYLSISVILNRLSEVCVFFKELNLSIIATLRQEFGMLMFGNIQQILKN